VLAFGKLQCRDVCKELLEKGGGRGREIYVRLREEEGMGEFEGCAFTKISNMGL
jgi:hypothetical protein